MKFIFKWLKNKIRQVERDDEKNYEVPVPTVSGSGPRMDSGGIRFTVYRADGGHVVETQSYDRHKDTQVGLYIVTSEQDLGQKLAHIITYEAIKR